MFPLKKNEMEKYKQIAIIVVAALIALCVGYLFIKILSALIVIGFYCLVFIVAYIFIRNLLKKEKDEDNNPRLF